MSLILRIDVDKPFGHHNMVSRIKSKISENYFNINWLLNSGYLMHLKELLDHLNGIKISAFIYFRYCTAPDKDVLNLLEAGEHHFGFHAENTRTEDLFLNELRLFEAEVGMNALSFTKHGSGKEKLGKNHYPKYEENKYIEWGKKHLSFYFGNGILKNKNLTNSEEIYFPNMFWVHSSYRDESLFDISKVIKKARKEDVCIIIHPSNYYTFEIVKNDFNNIIKQSVVNEVNWLKPDQIT